MREERFIPLSEVRSRYANKTNPCFNARVESGQSVQVLKEKSLNMTTTPTVSHKGAGLLSRDQIEHYFEYGYVVVPDLIDAESLLRLQRITDDIVATASGLSQHSNILDLESSHSPEAPRVRRIKRPHVAHPFYREMAGYQPIMDAIAPLIGPNIRMRPAGKINLKSGEYGSPVEWHQDWAFYPHTNQSVLAVGVLLDDMNSQNGPLKFLPGSHRGPVYDHHSDGRFCGAIDVVAVGLDVSQAVEIQAKAGSITVHHARLIHGSELNRSDQQRRILLYEYAAADAWPLAGIEAISDIKEFNSRIVYGQPTLQPRMEDVPVRMPLPIAEYQGSIYENQRTLSSRYFEEFQSTN